MKRECSSRSCGRPESENVVPCGPGPAPRPERGWISGAAARLCFAVSGLLALAWFLVRVIPKPSRAAYPCQRVAFPMASAFVLWLAGIAASAVALRRARKHLRDARYALACFCAAVGLAGAVWTLGVPLGTGSAAWDPQDPPNQPMGVAKGIHPGRVVWTHDPDATSWDGASNYWWSDRFTDQGVVDSMMSRAVRALAGEASDATAWEAIFRHFNRTRGRGDSGYAAGEGIAVKINMNVASDYALTNEPIASPQAVRALLRQLVRQAGVTESAISVYDASRCITDAIYTPCHAEFPGVQFVDGGGGAGRVRAAPADGVPMYYADSRVASSGTSRLPQCVVDARYLINMALLRGHSLAGVTLCAKNYFGSVWRPGGGFSPSNIHTSVDRSSNAMGARNSLVDLMGHEHLGGKVMLFMIDALYAAVNQGSSTPARWRSGPFNNDWTSSLFVSQDGVAMDSVAVDFCRSEPALAGTVTGQSVDNYLHEAALADNPPSGAVYDPEGDGTRLASLGVHEHWNDATEKKYSRNLGTGEGIEIVIVPKETLFRRGDANADGSVDISDAVTLLLHLFAGGKALACPSSADANDSGLLDVSDAIYVLSHLFLSGEAPPAPFADCGVDPTEDDLQCPAFPPCVSGTDPGTSWKLFGAEAPAAVLIPGDGSLGLSWTQAGFEDAGWIQGVAAVGYDENPDYAEHFDTSVASQMNDVNTTAYIRVPFTVAELKPVKRLSIWIKYDDGFIAYLNGTRVAERNAPAAPQWNSRATGQHDDAAAIFFEEIDITAASSLLAAGPNLLAIHGLNENITSSDFLIAVELEAWIP